MRTARTYPPPSREYGSGAIIKLSPAEEMCIRDRRFPRAEPVCRGCERQRRRGKSQRNLGSRVKGQRGLISGYGNDEGRGSLGVCHSRKDQRNERPCLEKRGGIVRNRSAERQSPGGSGP